MILENIGSLITIQGTSTCLGYLMDCKEHGVYDATLGKVEVSPEDAEAHNKLLDQASLEALDTTCEIGQGGGFYMREGTALVTTFMGAEVGTAVLCTRTKKTYMFCRFPTTGLRTFRGTKRGGGDSVFFKRVR